MSENLMLGKELQGQTALVTGGGRRVGREIVLKLASLGAHVVIHYNTSSQESDAVAAEVLTMGAKADTVRANLADPAQIDLMVSELDRHAIAVDILINCAAVYGETPLGSITASAWDEIIAVNLRAPFLLSQALGTRMKERGTGSIINICDCNIRRPYRGFTPYFASKAGLAIITETLALELSPEVRVNAISPGTVLPPDDATAHFEEQAVQRTPIKQPGAPQDISNMVAYLTTHGRFITGSNFVIDGGATIR